MKILISENQYHNILKQHLFHYWNLHGPTLNNNIMDMFGLRDKLMVYDWLMDWESINKTGDKFSEEYGDIIEFLELNNLKELPNGFRFPEYIGGYLNLYSLQELPNDIRFPEYIGGFLNLWNLKELPNDIRFPEHIDGFLDLRNLKKLPNDIRFPEHIGSNLYLPNLKELPNGIRFPQHIGGYMWIPKKFHDRPELNKFKFKNKLID